MRKPLSIAAALLATLALAAPVGAITNGTDDKGEHPFVGELLFYVPDAVDSRFDHPGGWFTCSGTLLDATHLVTAGHCTFGIGLEGASTTDDGADTTAATGGTGGNDVWVSFAPAPDFDILPPSSTFGRDENPARYLAWETALDASPEWHRATSTPHPLYDDNAFFIHDAGVLTFASPIPTSVSGTRYAQLPTANYLDGYKSQPRNDFRFETVGYGLERVQGKKEFGGDTRMQSHPKLDSLKSHPADTYIVLSNNTATGGTCFGDSGGPTFDGTTSNLIVAVTSWGQSPNCGGKSGVYRLDQPDDLAFLATFGVTP
ncbi:MAG: hypothetical protein QOF49_711 [Chloroflexota bacterium]|jgi:hypothetical protein|nr:hypothetical protein [Chloroflexota bacterium]